MPVVHPVVQSKLGLEDCSPERKGMFDELARLYHRHRVLSVEGFAPALVDTCPNHEVCWADCRDRVSRDANIHGLPGEDGSIFFPWIGTGYRHGGVCVIGWNLNHAGKDWFPLTEEHVIATASRAGLEDGHYKIWGSLFAYRSMSAAAAVCDAMGDLAPVVKPRPQRVAKYFERIARVQAVKCAPRGNRSNPTGAMNTTCPETFLHAELEILRPRALIVFGRDAREAALRGLRKLDQQEPHWPQATRNGYGRRQSLAPWGPLDMFSLWHPTYARWPQAQHALVADLTANPLNATWSSPGFVDT